MACVEVGERAVEIALAVIRVAAVVVGRRMVRIDPDRLVEVGDRLVELGLGVRLEAAIVESQRKARS